MAFRRWSTLVLVALACSWVQCGGGDDNGGGGGTQTTEVPAALGVPENLMASIQQNPLRVLLTWQYAGAEPVSFAVYRADNATDLAAAKLTATRLLDETDELFYTDNAVEPGKTYYYRVRAFEGTAIGNASQIVAVSLREDGGGGTVIIVQPPQAPGDGGDDGGNNGGGDDNGNGGGNEEPKHKYVIVPDRTAGGLVDDDLTVLLNGTAIYVDNDTVPSAIPDIPFQGTPGDILRVVARDEREPCGFMAGMTVKRICDNATVATVPPATRICLAAPGDITAPTEPFPGPAVFFDETYTLPRQAAGPGCE